MEQIPITINFLIGLLFEVIKSMQKIGLNMTNDAMNTILTSIFKHSQPSTQKLVEIDIRNRINELMDRTNRSTAEDEELSSLIKFSETLGLKTY